MNPQKGHCMLNASNVINPDIDPFHFNSHNSHGTEGLMSSRRLGNCADWM